jgi:hypothetical protein
MRADRRTQDGDLADRIRAAVPLARELEEAALRMVRAVMREGAILEDEAVRARAMRARGERIGDGAVAPSERTCVARK